jgi:hypothetical protein
VTQHLAGLEIKKVNFMFVAKINEIKEDEKGVA